MTKADWSLSLSLSPSPSPMDPQTSFQAPALNVWTWIGNRWAWGMAPTSPGQAPTRGKSSAAPRYVHKVKLFMASKHLIFDIIACATIWCSGFYYFSCSELWICTQLKFIWYWAERSPVLRWRRLHVSVDYQAADLYVCSGFHMALALAGVAWEYGKYMCWLLSAQSQVFSNQSAVTVFFNQNMLCFKLSECVFS